MELLLGLLTQARPELFNLTIVLVGVGALIKYRGTKKMKSSTELIPIVLSSIAFITCSLIGRFHSTATGPTRLFDTFVMGGLIDGFTVSAFAGLTWSSLRGIYKNRRKKTETESGGGL